MPRTTDRAGVRLSTRWRDPSQVMSWFHNPVGDFPRKASGDRAVSSVTLQCDHAGLGVERAVGVAEAQLVGEFERQGGSEKHFLRRAEFSHGAFAGGAGGVAETSEAYGNSHRRGIGEKLGQLGGRAFAS